MYKIASGCIAERIKLFLNKLIHKDQTGFKGIFIVENIRLIYDIMNYTESNDVPGLLILIDFEKASESFLGNLFKKRYAFLILVLQFKTG